MTRRYVVDAQKSRFTVQAFATGLLAGFGHSPKFAIRQFDGEFDFASDTHAGSSFNLTVKASSLELVGDLGETERNEIQKVTLDEVLEVGKYPEISFHSAKVALTEIAHSWFRARMRGDMRLHGTTKPVEIDSQLRLNDGEMRLSGNFLLSITDFKIKRVKSVGGLLKVKDELNFEFDLLGREEKSA